MVTIDTEKKKCIHPNHDFPKFLHIALGDVYKHRCPYCGKVTVVDKRF